MAPVIWGLDLKEMQWGKFKGSYMFSREYHLQRTKMIVYQIAMIMCVVSESIGTSALTDYVDQQDGISTRDGSPGPTVQNNDIVGILSYNIFIGIAVATIFGSGFFFDLFWPERRESRGVKMAWKISSVLVSLGALADAIALTVIVARNREHIAGMTDAQAAPYFLANANNKPNPVYRHNSYCVASTVTLWIGVVATFVSTHVMWKSLAHNEIHGPKSAEYRNKGEEAGLPNSRSNEGPKENIAPNGDAGFQQPMTERHEPIVQPGPNHPSTAQQGATGLPI